MTTKPEDSIWKILNFFFTFLPQKINNQNTIAENIYGRMFLMDTKVYRQSMSGRKRSEKGFPNFLTHNSFPIHPKIMPLIPTSRIHSKTINLFAVLAEVDAAGL